VVEEGEQLRMATANLEVPAAAAPTMAISVEARPARATMAVVATITTRRLPEVEAEPVGEE
jgi:hypothetical protein